MDKHIAEWLNDLTKAINSLLGIAINDINKIGFITKAELKQQTELIELRDRLQHYKLEEVSDDKSNGSTVTGEQSISTEAGTPEVEAKC